MNKLKMLLTVLVIAAMPVTGQQEIRIRISEGVSMIPVAFPQIAVSSEGEKDASISSEISTTIWDDLAFSRVFKMVPREHYRYIQKFDPLNIRFRDWDSIQASVLISASFELSGSDRIVLSFKVYDVKNEKFIFGRNFGGKIEFARLIAHRAADEMMKYFGEKPVFTSKIVFVSTRDGNDEIYMSDYDGKRIRRITYNNYMDLLPSWSRDNEKVMYTSYRKNNPDLLMYHLYSAKTEYISTRRANYCADWSPVDDRIVYTSTKSGNAEIYSRDIKTGRERQLTFNRVIDTTPNWSPSGREIAFTSQRSGTPQIYIMDAEGTNVRRITHEGTYHDSPEWSPDGSRIVYVSRIESRFDVYVYHLKSNTVSKLTENSGRNENPSWSPDGRHLVFSSNRTGRYQLYIMDYDGANLRRITRRGENKMPKWQKIAK